MKKLYAPKKSFFTTIVLILGFFILSFGFSSPIVYAAQKDHGSFLGDFRDFFSVQLRKTIELFTVQKAQNDQGQLKGDFVKSLKSRKVQALSSIPPSIELKRIEPQDDDYFRSNLSIPLEVQVGRGTGRIDVVEYYAAPYVQGMEKQLDNKEYEIKNLQKIGESHEAPYSFSWNKSFKGDVAVIVRAIDENGTISKRTLKRLFIKDPNKPPEIEIGTPSDGSKYIPSKPIDFEFKLKDSDSDTGVVRLDVLRDSENLFSTADISNTCLGSWKMFTDQFNGQDRVRRICEGGTEATYKWNWAYPRHGTYTLTIRATDSDTGKSKAWSEKKINLVVTDPPTASLLLPSPKDGFFHRNIDTIHLQPQVSDSDGTITKVELYRYKKDTTYSSKNDALIATLEKEPFTFDLTNQPLGFYTYGALAYDNDGAVSQESKTQLTEIREPNKLPNVEVISPKNGQIFQKNASQIRVKVAASDNDGTIANMQFFSDDVLMSQPVTFNEKDCLNPRYVADMGRDVCEREIPTHAIRWSLPVGNHTLKIKATDNEGAVTTKTITNRINNPPSVSLTSPTGSSPTIRPVDIKFSATASDSDGTISKIQFFGDKNDGSTLLGEVTKPPYEFVWKNPEVGAYKVKAVAFDNDDADTSTQILGVRVSSTPQVVIKPTTSVVNDPVASAGFDVTVSDEVGDIKIVQFYKNSTEISNWIGSLDMQASSVSSNTKTFDWQRPRAGRYTIIARAKNADGVWGQGETQFGVNVKPLFLSSSSSPAKNSVFTRPDRNNPASVPLNVYADDLNDPAPYGGVTKVEYFKTDSNGTKTSLGSVSNGPNYKLDWKENTVGVYDITAVATDKDGAQATNSDIEHIVVRNPNQSPIIDSFTASGGSVFQPGQDISFSASAHDPDTVNDYPGVTPEVKKVEFFEGTTLLNTATGKSPFKFIWQKPSLGAHTITARATDNEGATKDANLQITVKNDSPTISNLTVNTLYTKGDDITISVRAIDDDSGMDRVEFYSGSIKITNAVSVDGAVYSVHLTKPAVATYSFTAKAFDRLGATSSSPVVSVKVNNPPTLSFDSPVSNIMVRTDTPLTLSTTPTDSDGIISKVEFYRYDSALTPGSRVLIGTATKAPFTYSWIQPIAGKYSFGAKAFDNDGAVSDEKNIRGIYIKNPNNAPSATLVSPNDGLVLQPGATVSLSANASDSDAEPGDRLLLAFYDGSQKIADGVLQNNGAYTASWRPTNGTHTIFARATDVDKKSSDSIKNTITVKNDPPSVSQLNVNAVYQNGDDITLTVTATDSDSGMDRVEFYDNVFGAYYQNATKLTEAVSVSGSTYSIKIKKSGVGIHNFYATAFDKLGATSSSAISSVKVNAPPIINQLYLSPYLNPSFVNTKFTIYAYAYDTDGKVTQVEFFRAPAGGTFRSIGTKSMGPNNFTLDDTITTAGAYDYKVIATDNNGATATYIITDRRFREPNRPPTISMTSPQDGATFSYKSSGTRITLKSSASDPDGSVRNVSYYDGTNLIGSAGPPFEFVWNPSAGTHTLKAKAFDNEGLTAETATRTITVGIDSPTISPITISKSPALVGDSIDLSVTATDSNVGMNGVQFFYKYNDSSTQVALGWVPKPPSGDIYTFHWKLSYPGTYAIEAQAWNSYNVGSSKTPTTLTVATPPLAITWQNSSSFTIPYYSSSKIAPLQVDVTDPLKNYVSKVEFYDGDTLLGTDGMWSSSTRKISWDVGVKGVHALKVKAYNIYGIVTESTMNVTIVKQRPPAPCRPTRFMPCAVLG